LLAAAVDDDPRVRTAAMTALGQLAGPEQIPGMVQGVLKAEKGRERAAAEKAVMFVCSRSADVEQRAAPLLAAIETLSATDRRAMLSTLGRVGGPAARKTIEGAIAASDPETHVMGIHGLCNWPNARITARLIELAQTDQHPSHRTMALRALIRVIPLPDQRPAAAKLALLKQAMTLCTRDEERNLVLRRAAAIRIPETLRLVVPYLQQPALAQQACATIVELAHHRGLREPNKAEFDRALDRVIETSNDPTVVERARRYQQGQTWTRPLAP
jgi:HEAT repeat protein